MEHAVQVAGFAVVLILGALSLWEWWTILTGDKRLGAWSRFQPRIGVPWTGSDVLILVFASLVLEQLLLSLVDSYDPREALGPASTAWRVPGLAAIAADAPRRIISVALLVASSAAHLVWLAGAIVYLVKKCGALADDLGFEASHLGDDVRLGGTTFVAAVLPVYALQLALTQLLPSEHPLVQMARDERTSVALGAATISAVFVAPLYEEFLFRVVLQGWLEKKEVHWRQQGHLLRWTPGFLPIALTSALFGALHFGHGPDPIALFVLALFLGYAYRRTHRIYASLLAHAAFNALAMMQLWIAIWAGPVEAVAKP